MTSNFQDGNAASKIQFGPAWWFNDQKGGSLAQLTSLANHGALVTFIGMTTDSRSFESYPRHEYFRRLVCRELGLWVEGGEYPEDFGALTQTVRSICYQNAKQYFKL